MGLIGKNCEAVYQKPNSHSTGLNAHFAKLQDIKHVTNNNNLLELLTLDDGEMNIDLSKRGRNCTSSRSLVSGRWRG